MKYRVLQPNEIEAYNLGYQVGSRQVIVTDLVWESPEEKKLYRKGYNAGCQDRLRNNVSNVSNISNFTEIAKNNKLCVSNVSNVSRVSNVKPVIAIDNVIVSDIETNSRNDISQLSTARASNKFIPPTIDEVKAYAKQQNDMAGVGGFACTGQMAEEFWSNYAANGWITGNEARTPVRDWQAKLRQWAIREARRPASVRHETAKERKERENREKLEELKRMSLEAQRKG